MRVQCMRGPGNELSHPCLPLRPPCAAIQCRRTSFQAFASYALVVLLPDSCCLSVYLRCLPECRATPWRWRLATSCLRRSEQSHCSFSACFLCSSNCSGHLHCRAGNVHSESSCRRSYRLHACFRTPRIQRTACSLRLQLSSMDRSQRQRNGFVAPGLRSTHPTQHSSTSSKYLGHSDLELL